MERVDFHRTKYGTELLVDVGYVREFGDFLRGGRPHFLDFYDVLFVTTGRGTYHLDGEPLPVRPGAVLFTTPGQVRRWSVTRLDGCCLFFTAEFVEEFFSDARFLHQLRFFHAEGAPRALGLGRARLRDVLGRLARMQREIARLRSDSAHALRAGLYDLLIDLNRAYARQHGLPAGLASDPTVFRLRQLVERHFRGLHRVADYARLLRVTPGHLNVLARRHAGRTAGEVIRARVLLEARRRLRHTDDTAAAVAHDLGFADPAYFARFFRRETGQSPGAYRRGARPPGRRS